MLRRALGKTGTTLSAIGLGWPRTRCPAAAQRAG
jgi:hypothetical protein